MLPEENRLRKKKDIDRVYKKGQRFRCPLFLLITLAREDKNLPSRYAIVISKKVSSLAVQRNRGRRVLRRVMRSLLHQLKNGHDTIVLVAPGILNKDFEEIRRWVEKVFIQAKLFK